MTAIAPVFVLIGLGYAAVRSGALPASSMPVLGSLVARFALPALILTALSAQPASSMLHLRYLLAYALGSLLTLALGLLWAYRYRRQTLPRAALYGLGMACPNSAFIGFPIVQQVMGPVAAQALALCMLVENLLLLPLGMALSRSDSGAGRGFWPALGEALLDLRRHPIVLAIVAGTALSLTATTLPPLLARPVAMLGTASAPLALLVIGGSLAGLSLRGMWLDVSVVAAGKLLLHPLLVAAAMLWLAVPQTTLSSAGILLAAMPMMSIYPVLGQRLGMQGLCAAALLLATLSAFFTLGLVLGGLP